jgi:hypothetical protein
MRPDIPSTVGVEPVEPWRSFLREFDELLKGSVELRCLGGFVVSQQYGTDVALSKLERNADRDREDVVRLARAGLIEPHTLKQRYARELRPYLLSKHSWHDKTLELWIEMAWPTASRRASGSDDPASS